MNQNKRREKSDAKITCFNASFRNASHPSVNIVTAHKAVGKKIVL